MKHSFPIMLIIIIIIILCSCNTRNNKILSNSQQNKVDSLNSLALEFAHSDNEYMIFLSKKAIILAESIHYEEGVGCGFNHLGMANKFEKNYDEALIHYEHALRIQFSLDNKIEIAKIYKNIGLLFTSKNGNNQAIEYYLKAVDFYKTANLYENIGLVQINIGICYQRLDQYDNAIKYYQKALKTSKTYNFTELQLKALSNIGNSYTMKGDYDNALKAQYESLAFYGKYAPSEVFIPQSNIARIFLLMGDYENAKTNFLEAIRSSPVDKNALAGIYIDLGNNYDHLDQMDSCFYFLKKGLKIAQAEKNERFSNFAQINLADSYSKIGDYPNAIFFRKEARKNLLDSNSSVVAVLEFDLAKEYIKKKDYVSAIKHAEVSISIGEKLGRKSFVENGHEILIEVYTGLKLYEKAFFHQKEYLVMKDSIMNEETVEKIEDIKIKYQTEKKEAQLAQSQAENKVQQATLKTQKIGILSLVAILLIALGFLTFIYRQNKKINAQKNKIDHLFKELHHRVKNNLQSLASIMNLQSKKLTDVAAKDAILASKGRVQAMGLIHQKLLYRDNEVAHVNMADYLEEFFKDLIDIFEEVLQEVNYKIEADDINVKLDIAVSIALIINELVTNSFKYAFEQGDKAPELTVKLKEEGNQLHLTVKDNGRGLPENFDIEHSNSFGLQIVNMFTKQIKGQLDFTNEEGARYDLFVQNYQIS